MNIFDDIHDPNTIDAVYFYVDSVKKNPELHCEYEKLSVERFINDLKRHDITFIEKKVNKVFAFFNLLKFTKGIGAGEKFNLEPWQAFIVANLFGFYWTESKIRRYKYSHVEVARKNGKSTLSAAIALVMLIIDGEAAPEIYTAATKRDQAKIVWNEARRMIKASPALEKKIKLMQHHISYKDNDGVFEALASDSKTLDGLSPYCVIVDEIHEHKNRLLYDVLKSGTGSREQPLISTITTAGLNRESFAYRHRKMCIDILRGVTIDDAQFAIIFTLDEDDEWQDSKNWGKPNPNLNVSIKREYLKQEFVQAQNNVQGRTGFITKHLNVWTDAASVWIPFEVWYNLSSQPESALTGLDCWLGLDLAATTDITALVLMFPLEDSIQLIPMFWLPEESIKLNSDYKTWVQQGYIKTTPGNVTDYNFIKQHIYDLAQKYQVQSIAYDPWNATQLIVELENEVPDLCTPFRQGFKSMSGPMKEFERLVLSGKIIHNNNPVFNWMLQNVEVKFDPAGNIKPSKEIKTQKIDGIVAAIMALGELINSQFATDTADFDFEFI